MNTLINDDYIILNKNGELIEKSENHVLNLDFDVITLFIKAKKLEDFKEYLPNMKADYEYLVLYTRKDERMYIVYNYRSYQRKWFYFSISDQKFKYDDKTLNLTCLE